MRKIQKKEKNEYKFIFEIDRFCGLLKEKVIEYVWKHRNIVEVPNLLAIERRNNINEFLQLYKTASVAELAKRLGVTEETIRRDLKVMESSGQLLRTHGGAFISEKAANTVTTDARAKKNQEGKEVIARMASKLVSDGETLFLDSSTTAFYLAQALAAYPLTIITNSLPTASLLTQHKNIHLIMLGGDYTASMSAFYGSQTVQSMNDYFVDKAFFSCRSLDLASGLTDAHEDTCSLRRKVLSRSKFSCCIADQSKLGHSSYIRLCGFDGINALVTDCPLNQEWRDFLDAHDVLYPGKKNSILENG